MDSSIEAQIKYAYNDGWKGFEKSGKQTSK